MDISELLRRVRGAVSQLHRKAGDILGEISEHRQQVLRGAATSALSLLLAACIPAFSFVNELYAAAGSIGIAGETPEYSDEGLENYHIEDSDGTLSDSDASEIASANEEIERFMRENQEVIPAEYDSIINILLIGCDANEYKGYLRSDSMIILSIDTERSKVKLISLMRDMRVQVGGHYDKLNAAFAYDSSGETLLKTIEKNFLVHIDDFVCINYRAFKNAVDALGGVRVTVDEGDIAAINKCISDKAHHITQPGEQVLDGAQTLGFCQMRKVGTDFARTARQRIVMTELLRMAENMSLTEMKAVIEATLPNILTNMTQGELFWLALQAVSLDNIEIEELRIPLDHTWHDIVEDERSYISFDYQKNVDALHEMIFGDAEAALAAAESAAAVSSADAQ